MKNCNYKERICLLTFIFLNAIKKDVYLFKEKTALSKNKFSLSWKHSVIVYFNVVKCWFLNFDFTTNVNS